MTRPFVPNPSDRYTTTPNRVRVYLDESALDSDYPEWPWAVDGIEVNDDGLVVAYTEAIETFRTWTEAMAAVPSFIAEMSRMAQPVMTQRPVEWWA